MRNSTEKQNSHSQAVQPPHNQILEKVLYELFHATNPQRIKQDLWDMMEAANLSEIGESWNRERKASIFFTYGLMIQTINELEKLNNPSLKA